MRNAQVPLLKLKNSKKTFDLIKYGEHHSSYKEIRKNTYKFVRQIKKVP